MQLPQASFKATKTINIYETFHPFYSTLRFFGFISFQLDYKTGRISVRFRDLCWTFLWFCWSMFLLSFNIAMGSEQIGEKSSIVRKGLLYLLCFELLSCCLIIIFHFVKREKIATYLKLLHEFDEMCDQLEFQIDMGVRRVFIICTLILGLTSVVVLVVVVVVLRRIAGEPFQTGRELLLMFSYFHISEIYVLVTYQFMFSAFAIRSRFVILNQNMQFYFLKSHEKYSLSLCDKIDKETKHRLVQKFASMHDKANDAIDFVNATFSMELIPGIIFALTMNIFSLLSGFRLILNYDVSVCTTISNMLWGLLFSAFIIACVFAATGATKQGKKTGEVIHKIINSCKDCSLIPKLIATSTTYLIIILQNEQDSTDKTNFLPICNNNSDEIFKLNSIN